MSKIAIDEWYKEASGDIAANQSSMGTPDGSPMDAPNAQQAQQPSVGVPQDQQNAKQGTEQNPDQGSQQPQMPDVSQDPVAPDMPEEKQDQNFEDWKNNYFRESIKGDVSKLIEMIQQVRDTELDSYPRKFVEDNLQICFLRQHANIEKASKEIRKLIRDNLDRNNPSVSLVNHIDSTLQTMPELNSVFIKLKGLLGMKGDLHRKFVSAIIGGVQVGTGGNNEDVIYNERDYSIRLSTRYNDKWGRVDIGKWSLKEDDTERYLTEPEQRRLEEGSPEEKDVLRRRVVVESISDIFKKRGFVINIVGEDGTIYTLGWDISGSLKNAYTSGKIIVKTIQSENSEAMIDDDGKITPYVDVKIKYTKETGEVDEDGKPVQEEHDFMERIDGMLFLTAQFQILKEAASSFSGMVLKEIPYNGNPSDLRIIQRCVPSAPEILMRQC
jgi:hypothetical protein